MARILVVDDSESVFYFVRRELGEAHLVERLGAFTELASYLRECTPDLILLDLEMPALSGTAFALFLRRIERRFTRVLIHSSLAPEHLKKAAQEVKAVGILEKTSDGHRLRDAVTKCLKIDVPLSEDVGGAGGR